jgi:Cu2+-containing amine oxidase
MVHTVYGKPSHTWYIKESIVNGDFSAGLLHALLLARGT